MGISFHPLIILLIVLFFGTPFAKKSMTIKEFVYDLPVIGQLLEWRHNIRHRKREAALQNIQ